MDTTVFVPVADRDAPATPTLAVRARALTKTYGKGEAQVRALDGVDVDFEAGRFTAIMGPSGSGKSTLMHLLAGLDSATSGQAFIGGTEVTGMGDKALTQLRRDRIGFVFQQFNLLPMFTAEQNITLPVELAGGTVDRQWLDVLVRTLGLGQRLEHRPSELSGGQQQRVAIARALVAQPEVVFADEPTGNLDSRSGAEVLSFLRRSVRELGRTIIMVTHDPTAAAYADRVVLIADGRIAGEISDPTPEAVLAGLDALRSLETPVAGSGAGAHDGGAKVGA
ncbi:ABC transporter ATP-binding protein [Isoptericola variabilis]|uniref:Phosphonate-transporting ATPase n=1 Tax=Isoptericola variabilis (strain 225) TaxID=743718 RepID=F6FS48_ISOV2|nr:ABC transporter ATP-binding protein [Isoptericola variabilis]AEG45145.1 Phosphonate-transporting ATPase [Isoptericola variabilis 225]TWH31437.1 putative ABC transport system ATP-binding protein [Isoptericola variabilis J7]